MWGNIITLTAIAYVAIGCLAAVHAAIRYDFVLVDLVEKLVEVHFRKKFGNSWVGVGVDLVALFVCMVGVFGLWWLWFPLEHIVVTVISRQAMRQLREIKKSTRKPHIKNA